MKLSQRALAEKLSLSTATISKSLKNSPEIPARTRAQVQMLASQLGYRLLPAAAKKTDGAAKDMLTVCMLVRSDIQVGSSITAQANMVLAGVSEAVQAANGSVIVNCVRYRDQDRLLDPACQPVMMREGLLSGLVIQYRFPDDTVRQLAERFPCVEIVRHSADVRVDCVDLDFPHALGLIIKHLCQLGHRRIGFLGTIKDALTKEAAEQAWHHERFGAYVQALVARGLEYHPVTGSPNRFLDTDESTAVDQVVSEIRSGVTAWVTVSDAIGYEWVQRLSQRGIRIPQDVSITGVDGRIGPPNLPRLTSVNVPFEAMGRAAVGVLLNRIKDPLAPIQRLALEGTLFVGETTGPVGS